MPLSVYGTALFLAAPFSLAICMLGCNGVGGGGEEEPQLPDRETPAGNVTAERGQVWGKEAGGFVASLSADQLQFHAGQPLLVRFQLKNVASRPQTVAHSGFWPDHRLVVKDATGEEVPLTTLGEQTRAVFGPDTPRRKSFEVTLDPGELDGPYGPYDLRDYFEIGQSPTVYVQGLYSHGAVQVWSNELILTVDDTQPP